MATFHKYEREDLTNNMLQDAAKLFSENYGIWGPVAEQDMGSFAKQGRRIRTTPTRLEAQCIPPSARTTYIQVRVNDDMVGNVFATRWSYEGRKVCWVTQLCVDLKYRHQGLATKLLVKLRENEEDSEFGILSSQPFAIMAALRAFGRGIEEVDLSIAKDYATRIMEASPVEYVRTAKLHGSLFDDNVSDGTVSCADTGFFVDHTEPLEALAAVHAKGVSWPFGRLPEGHEFLAFVKRS